MKSILLADIGGTNIRFSIYKNGKMSPVTQFKTADFKKPEQVFDSYINALKNKPTHMILGVAGPVHSDVVHLTNRDWTIKAEKFEKRYHLTKCQLVNDFVLKGYGVLALTKKDYIALNTAKPQKNRPMCIIGPGTGLGVCFLTYCNNSWVAHASEAGHTDICAASPQGQEILDFLKQTTPYLSAEEILSGRGLVALYRTVCHLNGYETASLSPEKVCDLALNGDLFALKAYRHFFDFLATFAGNMGITLKTLGGIYITSSILKNDQIIDMLRQHDFKTPFENRGKMKKLVSDIPVFLVSRPKLAFLGLKFLAQHIEK